MASSPQITIQVDEDNNIPGRWCKTLSFKFGDRKRFWRDRVGTSVIPIVDLTPEVTRITESGQSFDHPCYRLDVAALGDWLYGRIVDALGPFYGMSSDEVREMLDGPGFLVKHDRDVVVSATVFHTWDLPETAPEDEPEDEPEAVQKAEGIVL